ncbi:hypothetical protein ElyMa_005661100 [Elysia marginata]|uniref:Uncharacterized protein n=1 Tax=Elysia marginata TaxID=1093978 RepID=A0AAV4FCJ3_9GAST|nr:hypothetical protein ElyMa_005661100 [Elysia marginata]
MAGAPLMQHFHLGASASPALMLQSVRAEARLPARDVSRSVARCIPMAGAPLMQHFHRGASASPALMLQSVRAETSLPVSHRCQARVFFSLVIVIQ